jgi:hypothetical protein
VVQQPVRTGLGEKSSSTNRSQSLKKSPKDKRTEPYAEEDDDDVVEQPFRTVAVQKPSSTNRSQSIKKSPRGKQVETYEEEDVNDDDYYYDDDEDYADGQENVSSRTLSVRRDRRESATGPMPPSRRVRYVRPKSTFKV